MTDHPKPNTFDLEFTNGPAPDGPPQRVVVVFHLKSDDAPPLFANMCAVLEDCMTINNMQWNTNESVAVFFGMTYHALSYVSAAIYSRPELASRVHRIQYGNSKFTQETH